MQFYLVYVAGPILLGAFNFLVPYFLLRSISLPEEMPVLVTGILFFNGFSLISFVVGQLIGRYGQ